MNDIGIKPLADRVVIQRIEERTTSGGIVIPETAGDKSQKGIIVAVGPGKIEDGILQQMILKNDDTVIFNKYSGTEITIKGKEYIVMKEEDVIAIIE